MSENATAVVDSFPLGFEEIDILRSAFIRALTLRQIASETDWGQVDTKPSACIPKRLIRYWHDPHNVPADVQTCFNSWDRLEEEGFEIQLFDDRSAGVYISNRYGLRERKAFDRCRHPAMRCDYLRMCVLFAEGGFYVDADDVLISDGWKVLFTDASLKVQPLCYDVPTGGMVPLSQIWCRDLSTDGRIFYVNNDPIVAPANHPLLLRALERATDKLLGDDPLPEIQSTTGPGNLTVALAVHARELMLAGAPLDFKLLSDWDEIAETRWELSYRKDSRNWRNMVNS